MVRHTDAEDGEPTTEDLADYEPYTTTASWSSNVDESEPDDRLDAAEGATLADAVALERKAEAVGVDVENNYLAYLADDRSEFPAGKEHAANAQARFVAGGDPIDEYTDNVEGFHGIKNRVEGGYAGTDGTDEVARCRGCLIAGIGCFGEYPPNPGRVYVDDLSDDTDARTDGGTNPPTPDDLADLEDGDMVEVDTVDGDTVSLTVEDPRHPNLGGRKGNGQYSRYFARDDGKRVSLCAYHEDKNDERRRDATLLINRTATSGIMDNVDVDRTEVVDWRRPATDGGNDDTPFGFGSRDWLDPGPEVPAEAENEPRSAPDDHRQTKATIPTGDDAVTVEQGDDLRVEAGGDVYTGTFRRKTTSNVPNKYADVTKHRAHFDTVDGGFVVEWRTEHEPQTRHYPGYSGATIPSVDGEHVEGIDRMATDGGTHHDLKPTCPECGNYPLSDVSYAEEHDDGTYKCYSCDWVGPEDDAEEPDVDVPCESCGRETEPTDQFPNNDRLTRTCTWCGCHTDADGVIPPADDVRCATCDGPVKYGPFKDARKGIRGYWCPSCDGIVSTEDEPPVATDGGEPVTVAVEHDDHEHTVGLERFEAGFVALLIASSRNTIDSPDVDEDRVDDVYAAFMSPVTSTHDDGLRADGGNPPGEDVSVAPNYEAGGVWFTLGDLPRRLLSPSDARAVADHVEDTFGPTPDGYDDVDDMANELRRLADEVEAKVDDPHVAAFDDIPLTD